MNDAIIRLIKEVIEKLEGAKYFLLPTDTIADFIIDFFNSLLKHKKFLFIAKNVLEKIKNTNGIRSNLECYKKTIEQLKDKLGILLKEIEKLSIYSQSNEYKKFINKDKFESENEVWNDIGIVYHYENKYKEAIRCYKKAIEIKENAYNTLNNIGITYHIQNCYDEAINYHKKAIEIKPNFYKAWMDIGDVYFDNGQYDKAIESCEEEIKCYRKEIDNISNSSLNYNSRIKQQIKNAHERMKEIKEKKLLIITKETKIKFNIPELLIMDFKQIRAKLGKPTFEFIPNELQLNIDSNILAEAKYQKGTTYITIQYSKSGKINNIFIWDTEEEKTKDEILELGNINANSKKYQIKVKNWIKAEIAKKNKEAQVAGIEVRISTN